MRDSYEDQRKFCRTIPMVDVIEMVGLGPVKHHKIHSIYREEKTPSLHVYDLDYFDFATGQGGDQIRFVMDHFGCSYGKAVQFLTGRAGRFHVPDKIPPKKPKEKRDFNRMYVNAGGGPDYGKWRAEFDLLRKRKWPSVPTKRILDVTKIVEGAHWTPHYDRDWKTITGIKVRSLYPGNYKSAVPGSTFTDSLYRPWVTNNPEGVVLVEGESDAWVMGHYAPRHQVYGLPSGAATWRDDWLDQLCGAALPVSMMLDRDMAGVLATEKIALLLDQAACTYRIFEPPTDGRVAESIGVGWKPDLLVD